MSDTYTSESTKDSPDSDARMVVTKLADIRVPDEFAFEIVLFPELPIYKFEPSLQIALGAFRPVT